MHLRGKLRIDPRVVARAIDLIARDFGPSAIHRSLEDEFGRNVVSLRWVKALRASLRAEPSEPWRFLEADPEEAASVLPVLGEVIKRTDGRIRHVTKAEADAILRIRVAAPDIPAWTAYVLARQFIVATPDQSDLLVEYLAQAPWRQEPRYETAAEAVGLMPHDPNEEVKGAD